MLVMLLGSFTYAQITDGDYTFEFACAPITAQELEAERIGLLDALDDNKAYARVEGSYSTTHPDHYVVRVIGTSLDGTESDYYGTLVHS